jgi:penicillin amidase
VPRIRRYLLLLLLPVALAVGSQAIVSAAPQGWTTLDVDGVTAKIYRDQWGIPHIFAPTDRALLEAYGYTVAEDRLFQLEVDRRAARGTLAAVFGPSVVAADELARRDGYTDAELDAQFASLRPEDRELTSAYVDGINRYITEVVLADPAEKLPYEFQMVGLTPAPWTARDVAAFSAFMVRRVGEIGGGELNNQKLLDQLIAAHGETEGWDIFNDLTWVNDPDSPVSVNPVGVPEAPPSAALSAAQAQAPSAVNVSALDLDKAKQLWASLGIPVKLGSYAWAIAPEKSASHSAMLYGGPQMGFDTPPVIHEVQLVGANGFNVMGMAFAGVPGIIIGRNKDIAWTATTGQGDNVDTYRETLCGPTSYMFNGVCTAMEVREETIEVRNTLPGAPLGTAAQTYTVMRTVHGPVIAVDEANGVAYSQKRAHWMKEFTSGWLAFGQFARSHTVAEFEAGAKEMVTSDNWLYADNRGNIAYWQAGQVPIRPAGYDPRLPLPGTGEAEWTGGTLPMPVSINPDSGWLANWNNKPAVWYNNPDDNPDHAFPGKQQRILEIQQRLFGPQLISLDDMFDIPKDIARLQAVGRDSRYILPYLLSALSNVSSSNELVPQATSLLQSWYEKDQNIFDDAVTSTTDNVAYIIYWVWRDKFANDVFGDELGGNVKPVSPNVLIHLLDGAKSGVPPHLDYFNGADPSTVMVRSLEEALDSLTYLFGTSDVSEWMVPRGDVVFKTLLGTEVGRMPWANRSTYAQAIVLAPDEVTGYNIIPLGQSGFIAADGTLDPHFRDQLDLFRNFEYKHMNFYESANLNE